MFERWNLTVCSVTHSIFASFAFEWPCHQLEDLALAPGQVRRVCERPVAPAGRRPRRRGEEDGVLERLPHRRRQVVRVSALDRRRRRRRRRARRRRAPGRRTSRARRRAGAVRARAPGAGTRARRSRPRHRDAGDEEVGTLGLDELERLEGGGRLADHLDADSIQDVLDRLVPEGMPVQDDGGGVLRSVHERAAFRIAERSLRTQAE